MKKLPSVKIGKARTIFSGYLGGNQDAILDANALAPQDTVPPIRRAGRVPALRHAGRAER